MVWTTTGTPVGTGAGIGSDVEYAEPFPRTWLSLPRYAHIMGLNPMSFHTAVARNADGEYVLGGDSSCNDIWHKYDWQDSDKISRYALALAIQDAEMDIAQVVGYPLAPTWIAEEAQPYPHYHRPGYYTAYDARGLKKSVMTNWGKVLAPGRRAVTLIGSVAPTYHDLDGDGFFETARVAIATTHTSTEGIKVYYHDTDGHEEWEIRHCRQHNITGGIYTADFFTWQFIDPDLYENFPVFGDNIDVIDISGNPPGNIVGMVDVYYEHNDSTQASAQFVWGAQSCLACGETTQDGCFDIRNSDLGEVAPWPATYDEDSESWVASCFSVGTEPEYVKLWYFAGEYNQRYLRNLYSDSLSDKMARVIARMATARLSKPLCTCGQTLALFEYLTKDVSSNTSEMTSMVDLNLLGNPFGTKRGEIEAWNYVSKIIGEGTQGAYL